MFISCLDQYLSPSSSVFLIRSSNFKFCLCPKVANGDDTIGPVSVLHRLKMEDRRINFCLLYSYTTGPVVINDIGNLTRNACKNTKINLN